MHEQGEPNEQLEQEEQPRPVVILTEGAIRTPDEEEAAAALAAVTAYLAAEEAAHAYWLETQREPWQWRASRVAVAQRMPPGRPAVRPTWGNVERLRRVGLPLAGITGL